MIFYYSAKNDSAVLNLLANDFKEYIFYHINLDLKIFL